jgi:hypothetical protein
MCWSASTEPPPLLLFVLWHCVWCGVVWCVVHQGFCVGSVLHGWWGLFSM